jgi:hypothetical protein
VRELDRETDVDERAQQRCWVVVGSSTSASVVPVSRFIVKNGRPSASVPSSWTGTIAG